MAITDAVETKPNLLKKEINVSRFGDLKDGETFIKTGWPNDESGKASLMMRVGSILLMGEGSPALVLTSLTVPNAVSLSSSTLPHARFLRFSDDDEVIPVRIN